MFDCEGGGVANHYITAHRSSVADELILHDHFGDQNVDTEFTLSFATYYAGMSGAAVQSQAALDSYMATTPAATWWAARATAWKATVRQMLIDLRG